LFKINFSKSETSVHSLSFAKSQFKKLVFVLSHKLILLLNNHIEDQEVGYVFCHTVQLAVGLIFVNANFALLDKYG
jgi:hypothetical protein